MIIEIKIDTDKIPDNIKDWLEESGHLKDDKEEKKLIELQFEKFFSIYPRKTPLGRVLRPSSLSSKISKTAKIIFLREVKTETEAKLAVKGLTLDLLTRHRASSVEYINNLQTYIRNKTWELHLEEDTDPESDIDTSETHNYNML